MKNDRFSCIYTEDRHEELRYDGGCVYQWCATRHHLPRDGQLHTLSSILSVNKNRFTKHYFIGDKRIASRIGTGLFNNVYGRNGSYVTAGQQDYAERMNQIQKQKEAYYKKVGVAPGVPTEKGAYGDPENAGVGYNAVLSELGNYDVPQGWIQTPRPNTTPNTNPGPPVSWNDPSNSDDPQPDLLMILCVMCILTINQSPVEV